MKKESEKGVDKYPARVYYGYDQIPLQGMNGEMTMDCDRACSHCDRKTKKRSEEEYRHLLNRLSRIEGQIRGIRGMVEKDAYCTDILMQVSAVTAALNAFNKELLSNHIRTCVADDIRGGKDEAVDELVTTLQKLMK